MCERPYLRPGRVGHVCKTEAKNTCHRAPAGAADPPRARRSHRHKRAEEPGWGWLQAGWGRR